MRDHDLEIRILGPLEALRGSQPVPPGGPKPRALLARLALDPGHVVSVDRIVEDLWPTGPPETAPHAVQVYVSGLRTALGSATIATRTPGYALELDPARVDAHRFARLADDGRGALDAGEFRQAQRVLREALGLWRGSALADFLYEPFAQAEIARLEELRLVALEARIDADLALGQHADLVPELEALMEAQTLREGPARRLMLALYRSGRQAEALAAYRRFRASLIEELGIEAGPELRELEASILRQDESLLPASPAVAMQFRRLVAVLVARLALSAGDETLDPEAAADVVRSCLDAAAAAVTRHGGTIQHGRGDSLTAVFGVPVAHEDDSLRAARAALEVRDGLSELSERTRDEHAISVEVTVGVEVGEAVVASGAAAGPVIGLAAALADAAADDVIVGGAAAQLIDHAATLEPLDPIAIRGVRSTASAFKLLGLAPAAPAFERRFDARFVGRTHELAALRRELRIAIETASTRALLVSGAAGVGKSRLAVEFAQTAKDATVLWGRCLASGEGMTYSPLREVLAHAGPSTQRDVLVEALEATTPPPAGEIVLATRRFCELLARDKPLVLVFDDVHWAEPTFLDLIEHIVATNDAAILVLCISREELLEERPAFLHDGQRLALDALPAEDVDAVLEGLGAAALATEQRRRVIDAAGGNALFLEQLLASALEGGGDRIPVTIQALLAARLDRLGPGERAVLERGAVVGGVFTADDVASLLDGEAAKTTVAHLRALAKRGFVRAHQGSYAVRHVLVQEAVYRAAPKRLRAELHARFADRIASNPGAYADVDEVAGYHLEQAHRLRAELRRLDEQTAQLADEAGRRLGAAGVRALQRGDMHAAANLLSRSVALLAEEEPRRRELLCELALVRVAGDDLVDAERMLAQVLAAPDAATAARARIELEYVRLRRQPQLTAEDLLAATAAGIDVFDLSRDRRALGRAWLLTGYVHGGLHGNHRAWQEAAERALTHYKAAGWPTSTCVGEIAAALYWGPARVDDAIDRNEVLLQDERLDLAGRAYLLAFSGGLLAQRHELERARELAGSAQATLEELGMHAAAESYSMPVLADIELLAGDARAAEQILRELCERHAQANDFGHLASRAGDLAEALLEQGRIDEADEWTRTAERHAAPDDFDAQMWRAVRARIGARRGGESMESLAREAVGHADRTDALNRRAKAQFALGEVLLASGDAETAGSAFARALELYEEKGNLAGAARARSHALSA